MPKPIYIFICLFLMSACLSTESRKIEEAQFFNIDISQENSFYTSSGVRLELKEAFRKKMTDQKLDSLHLRVDEYLSIQSFIKNDLLTITDENKILESFGMYRVTVLNSELEIAENEICFELHFNETHADQNIRRYEAINKHPYGTVWTNPQSPQKAQIDSIRFLAVYTYDADSGEVIDSSFIGSRHQESQGNFKNQEGNTFYIDVPNNTLINLDAEIFKPDMERFTLELETKKEIKNKMFGIVFKDFNSYIRPYSDENGVYKIDIPNRSKIEIFCVGQIKDQFYYGRTSLQVDDSRKIILKLFKSTEEKIQNQFAKM